MILEGFVFALVSVMFACALFFMASASPVWAMFAVFAIAFELFTCENPKAKIFHKMIAMFIVAYGIIGGNLLFKTLALFFCASKIFRLMDTKTVRKGNANANSLIISAFKLWSVWSTLLSEAMWARVYTKASRTFKKMARTFSGRPIFWKMSKYTDKVAQNSEKNCAEQLEKMRSILDKMSVAIESFRGFYNRANYQATNTSTVYDTEGEMAGESNCKPNKETDSFRRNLCIERGLGSKKLSFTTSIGKK